MTGCLHRNLHVTRAAYTVPDPRDINEVIQSLHLGVQCSECGNPFRFLGDMPLSGTTPLAVMLRKGGAWVSNGGNELGVMIAPFGVGEALEMMDVEGRA